MVVRTEQLPREWRAQAERYLNHLRSQQAGGKSDVSTSDLASASGVTEKEARHLIAALTDSGQLRASYPRDFLRQELEQALGHHNLTDIVLLGKSAVAEALLTNASFAERGFAITAAFAANVSNERVFRPYAELNAFCRDRHVHLGIIATPAEQAEDALERLSAAGTQGIWNVSGAQLTAPKEIVLENEKFGEHEEIRDNPHVSLSIKAIARQVAERLGWNEE